MTVFIVYHIEKENALVLCGIILNMKNPKNIKLIVSDVDSTLIAPGTDRISPRLKRNFDKAMAKGIHVMINTGRHYTFIQPSLFEDLPMDFIGTINGACLVDRNGKTIEKHSLSEKAMNKIIAMSDAYEVGLGFKFEDHLVTYANHEKFINGYCPNNQREQSLVVNDCETRKHHLSYGYPLGIFLICDQEVAEKMSADFPELTFAWSHREGYDAFLNTVTKATCVEPILKHYGITWDEVMACGDAGNDTPFIQKAGLGVVVKNAKDDVLSVADYIAPACADDGIAIALEELEIVEA